MSFDNSPIATIHLDHIRDNFQLAKSRAPNSQVMAVIKANAYGHGVKEVALALKVADSYAVARVGEAVALRQQLDASETKPIVVLEGFLGDEEYEACVEYNLQPMIHSDYQLNRLEPGLSFWLKFNTGMFRLGFPVESAQTLIQQLEEKNIAKSLLGVVTHLANADDPDNAMNSRQIERIQTIKSHFGSGVALSIANSGGILGFDHLSSDWIRPGLMLYGGSPTAKVDHQLKAGMTLTAPIIAINQLNKGDAVGYGGRWVAEQKCRVAVVALGYADGYPREMPTGSPVMVNGKQRQLVGRVSMDMCTVLLTPEDEVSESTQVEFWGNQLPIDNVAATAGTISYTLMTGLGARVRRVFY